MADFEEQRGWRHGPIQQTLIQGRRTSRSCCRYQICSICWYVRECSRFLLQDQRIQNFETELLFSGDSKRAMDEYTSEIAMGGHNTLVIHNTCEDSLLAIPLILDLVILGELCARIKVSAEHKPNFSTLIKSYFVHRSNTTNPIPSTCHSAPCYHCWAICARRRSYPTGHQSSTRYSVSVLLLRTFWELALDSLPYRTCHWSTG